jgi:MATE family multidrug resistance protein
MPHRFDRRATAMTNSDTTQPSFAGTNRIVTGPVRPVMLALVWPVLTEQFLNTLVGLIDTFLAGNLPYERVAATSAVGLAAYAGWLVSMLFALVGTGTTALVARSYGAGDRAGGNEIANQSIMMAIIMGLVGSVGMYALAPYFAGWLEMRGLTFDITVRYLRIDALAYAVWAVSLVGAAALRGAGDMRTPLKVLALVNLLNVIISPTLVYGWGPFPSLGVDGIVVGTVCARIGGGVLIVLLLVRGRFGLRLSLSCLRPVLNPIMRILRIGLPAALDGAIMWTGHFLFLKIVGHIGSTETSTENVSFAAQIVVVRLEAFTYLPASAWAAACATMIGQALGARSPDRARRCGHEGVLQCALLTALVGLCFVMFAGPIIGLLNKDAQVIALATPVLMLVGFFQPVLSSSIVYQGSLRGAGDTVFPMLFTVVGLAVVRVPLGYLFGITLGWGLFGAWIAVCADLFVRMTFAFIRFARGRWITREI